ncbi:MAG: RNA polymerase sigma factor [Pyrinomonadaceae bacterium]
MNFTSTLSASLSEPLEEVRDETAVRSARTIEFAEITSETSDFELCQMAAGGNLEAFEMLYTKYHRRAFSLCLRMTNSVAEAEDLTQEAFIQLYRKVGSFRGDSAFTTWFHRLTVNQVLMHFRKRSIKNEKTTEDGEVPEVKVQTSDSMGQLPILNRMDIKKAIAGLPPGYRSVFVLHDVEGFEHTEVAEMLGISVGTSKSQLHKARLKLRGLLVR